MPSAVQISEVLIQESISNAVQDVCRTMMQNNATLIDRIPSTEAVTSPVFEVIGNVGFVGEANGIIYLCMTDDFACFAVGAILGMSLAEVRRLGPEILQDAIGELTNMTVGGFKNALCDVGFPCKLTLPAIVRGQNLQVASIKGTTRHRFRFNCADHILVADIQLKTE